MITNNSYTSSDNNIDHKRGGEKKKRKAYRKNASYTIDYSIN